MRLIVGAREIEANKNEYLIRARMSRDGLPFQRAGLRAR
jgi:hypothetical protein